MSQRSNLIFHAVLYIIGRTRIIEHPAARRPCDIPPARITMCLRVATDIGIGAHPLQVPLLGIRRQEHADKGVIVARVVVIQLGERVIVLAGIALGCGDRALAIGTVAIGPVDLIAQHRRAAHRVADAGDHAAQQIGEQEFGLAAIEVADQVPCQAVVVFVAVAGATAVIDVILHAKGVDGVFGVARARAGLRAT